MQAAQALGRIVDLVRDLRKRCSWDAAQTRETLRPYLVEEVMELDQDLALGDAAKIRDELGDLLLHLAFQIVLGEERGEFGAEDVTRAIEAKMWRRHPHLFPDKVAPGAGAPPGHSPATWERHKRAERGPDGPGLLDGLPPGLPALIMAARLQERAAGVGFDWPDTAGPAAKVREELGELEEELGKREAGRGKSGADAARDRIEAEVGDLLFSVVNLARKSGVDARAALEKANARFVTRFRRMEAIALARGVEIGGSDLAALDRLWDEAKGEES